MDDANPSALKAGAVPVLGGVTPYLAIDGALRAVEFYKAAFGAEVAAAIPADAQGRTMHAHLYINGGSLMLSDFFPEHGHAKVAPQSFTLTLVVEDVDGWGGTGRSRPAVSSRRRWPGCSGALATVSSATRSASPGR